MPDMTEIESWACRYVENVDPNFATLTREQKLAENLFTSGRLDSMGLMNLLLDAEGHFSFMFTPEAFQDRRLHTITGLGAVISELKDAE